MATPAPKAPVYGTGLGTGAPTDYLFQPQPTPMPQPVDLNRLFQLLGGTQQPKLTPPGVGMGGVGGPIGIAPSQPVLDRTVLDDMSPPAPYTPLPPGFVPENTPRMVPPQTGMGMTPPMGAVTTPPYAPEVGPEIYQPQAAQGLDMQRLMAALRAMQSRRQPTPTPERGEGSPRMAPSPAMGGSGMGLGGLLEAIRASKQSAR
jgi:hypothetical protein